MSSVTDSPNIKYAEYLLQDAANRVRLQHEFALAGMRTLVLINGGAIVSLLTYIGNAKDLHGSKGLQDAFLLYAIALVCTVVSYLLAYLSQGAALYASTNGAAQFLNLTIDSKQTSKAEDQSFKRARKFIFGAIIATILALSGFIAGSFYAMHSLI